MENEDRLEGLGLMLGLVWLAELTWFAVSFFCRAVTTSLTVVGAVLGGAVVPVCTWMREGIIEEPHWRGSVWMEIFAEAGDEVRRGTRIDVQ